MAPETLLSSQQASAASDQYAIGVILYELLCGLRPRQQTRKDPREKLLIQEDVELLSKGKAPHPIVPPAARGAVRCPGLQKICLRCLRADPTDRYSSIAELATDLERWLEGEQTGGGPLSEFWNAWIYRPVKRQPFRHLLAVGGALTTILLIMTAADALERTTEAEQRAVALNAIVEERNRRNHELTQTLSQLRTQLQLFLETLRSLTELTLEQDFVSSPATLELRSRVLKRVGNDCCRALQSASTNLEKQVLLDGSLSELVRILLRTGELEQARQVGKLLLQVSEECLTSFADVASPAVTEHLNILLLLTDLELEAQNMVVADQYLQALSSRLPQSSEDSAVLHWQAEVARRLGHRKYLEYTKHHDPVAQKQAVDSARRFAEQDLELRRRLLKRHTDPAELVNYCTTLASLSLYCYKGGDSTTAIETQNESLNILGTLIEDSSVSEEATQQFVRICFNGVMPLRKVGQVQQALELAELGLQQARKLVELHPLVLRHQQELARGHGNQAETLLVIYLKHNDPVLLPDILKNLQTSAHLFRAVHQRDPGRSRARDDAVIQMLRQTVIQCLLNQPELARRVFLEATVLADLHPRKTFAELEPGNGLNALGERLGTALVELDQISAETAQTTTELPAQRMLNRTHTPEMESLLGDFPQLRQNLAQFLNP
jgi:tetratricopeptide (TPR) repeat protein